MTRSMLTAIAGVHAAGVVHRDIKTENFLVAGDYSIKLGDFGLVCGWR